MSSGPGPAAIGLPDLPDDLPGCAAGDGGDDGARPGSLAGLNELFAEARDGRDALARAASAPTAPYATAAGGAHGAGATRWAVARIGATLLEISTEGQIKPAGLFQPATYGSPHAGTPYRVYTVCVGPGRREQYYVHDLVYKAFAGDPPAGWRVRHRTKNFANNALANLTVMPDNVSYPEFTPLTD